MTSHEGLRRERCNSAVVTRCLRHEWIDARPLASSSLRWKSSSMRWSKPVLAPVLEVNAEAEFLPQRAVLGLRLAPWSQKHDGSRRSE